MGLHFLNVPIPVPIHVDVLPHVIEAEQHGVGDFLHGVERGLDVFVQHAVDVLDQALNREPDSDDHHDADEEKDHADDAVNDDNDVAEVREGCEYGHALRLRLSSSVAKV